MATGRLKSSEALNILGGNLKISFGILLVSLCLHEASSQKQPIQRNNEYDFIVVGGGTSGCVLASRLVSTGLYKVLLIASGRLVEPELAVPAVAFNLLDNPAYESVQVLQSLPQNNAALVNNGTVNFLVGKALGGGSAVNGMFWNRGHPWDYNKWARDSLNEDWGYERLLPYFKKSENYSGHFRTDQRGYEGPITISATTFQRGLNTWMDAGRELGYPIADPNGPQKISFAYNEWSQKNSQRVSSYDGYIRPLLESPLGKNLEILMNTEATKIIFEGKRAVGVQFVTDSNGQRKRGEARVTKEVIVTAGVVGSPALLLRSGIGPRPFLDDVKIPAIQYLTGVGKNLQDHVVVCLPIIVRNGSSVFNAARDLNPSTWRQYRDTGTGPYSSYGGAVSQAFIPSPKPSTNWRADFIDGWPDTHLIFLYGPPPASFVGGYNVEVEPELGPDEALITVITLVGRPQSRGTVTLDENNLDGPPLIDFRFLTNRADMQVAVEGLKATTRIARTNAFQQLGARLPRTPYHACAHLKLYSDDYFRCYVGQTSASCLHAVGTNRIGAGPTDRQAVVDTQLRVLGVRGLRIADASVFPNIVNGNTQAAVYAVAEKASDMILNAWIPGFRSSV